MSNMRNAVERFFQDYAVTSNNNDTTSVISQFAETFIAAGPDGATAVRAEDFARFLPIRKQQFASAGCKSTRLVSKNVTELDERYCVVETKWAMEFVSADQAATEIQVGSTFLVDTGDKTPKILAYLSHGDALKLLDERFARR